MADAEELNELRSQRQKVAEHLLWLERLIESCEAELSDSPSPPPQPASNSLTEENVRPDTEASPIEYDPQIVKSNVRAQSLGCIAVAAAVAVIAVFTLWILPGLIYD